MKFRDYLEEQLKNPGFKKEYESMESEYAVKQLFIDLRIGFKSIVPALIKMSPDSEHH